MSGRLKKERSKVRGEALLGAFVVQKPESKTKSKIKSEPEFIRLATSDFQFYKAVLPQLFFNQCSSREHNKENFYRDRIDSLLDNASLAKSISGNFLEDLIHQKDGRIDRGQLKEVVNKYLSSDEKSRKAYISTIIKPMFDLQKDRQHLALINKLLKEESPEVDEVIKDIIIHSIAIEKGIEKRMEGLTEKKLKKPVDKLNSQFADKFNQLNEQRKKLKKELRQLEENKKTISQKIDELMDQWNRVIQDHPESLKYLTSLKSDLADGDGDEEECSRMKIKVEEQIQLMKNISRNIPKEKTALSLLDQTILEKQKDFSKVAKECNKLEKEFDQASKRLISSEEDIVQETRKVVQGILNNYSDKLNHDVSLRGRTVSVSVASTMMQEPHYSDKLNHDVSQRARTESVSFASNMSMVSGSEEEERDEEESDEERSSIGSHII